MGGENCFVKESSPDQPPYFKAHMELDYEQAIALQGSWGYTPTTPLMDQQATDIKEPQPSLHQLVTQTISYNMQGQLK